jgi:hypothetical protein
MYLYAWSLQAAIAEGVDEFLSHLQCENRGALADYLERTWKGLLKEAHSLDRYLRNHPKDHGWSELDGARQSLTGTAYEFSAWLVRFAEHEDMNAVHVGGAPPPERKGAEAETQSDEAAKATARTAAPPKALARPRIRKGEANIRARAILKQDPDLTAKELAKKVPCSIGLIPELPAWQAVMEERKKGRKPKSPKAVSLTGKTEAVVGEEDPTLKALIEEQAGDGTADGSIAPFKKCAKSQFTQRRKV